MNPQSTDPRNTPPLTGEELAAIRADLGAVPAPPWCWIGNRGAGGPELVTDHSGRQYLLRAAKPADIHGDELLDPADDSPIYGDLQFRDQRAGEKYSTMRDGNQLAVGRTSYNPDSIVGVDNPVARWIERSPAHTEALLAEVDRLQARVAALEPCFHCGHQAANHAEDGETDCTGSRFGCSCTYFIPADYEPSETALAEGGAL